ncbi:hypothetical protein CCACVL1_12233 [Corchorus capsularis]|uniref:Uncharacterized protein n=1 Tax=Corchorus capsularis TaxID=210143 RepID=A0A1R3IGQ1_COCAP|nr:hypothetical protein CCACVL1_12233 [Corchorus capsularis]
MAIPREIPTREEAQIPFATTVPSKNIISNAARNRQARWQSKC